MTWLFLRKQEVLALAFGCAFLVPQAAFAQERVASAGFPETVPAEEASVEPKPVIPDLPNPEDRRILGVVPNYRTADGTLPFHQVTAKYKMTIAAKDSFDWPNNIIGGIFAGIYQVRDEHPSFGQGVLGSPTGMARRIRTR